MRFRCVWCMGEAHAWGLRHHIKGGAPYHASAVTLARANISGCTAREEKLVVFIGCALFLLSEPIFLSWCILTVAWSHIERLIFQTGPNFVLVFQTERIYSLQIYLCQKIYQRWRSIFWLCSEPTSHPPFHWGRTAKTTTFGRRLFSRPSESAHAWKLELLGATWTIFSGCAEVKTSCQTMISWQGIDLLLLNPNSRESF